MLLVKSFSLETHIYHHLKDFWRSFFVKKKLTSFSRSLFITIKLYHRCLTSQMGWVLIKTPEAATGGVLWKKMLLKISQKSQACNFIKKETPTQVFSCEFPANQLTDWLTDWPTDRSTDGSGAYQSTNWSADRLLPVCLTDRLTDRSSNQLKCCLTSWLDDWILLAGCYKLVGAS